MDRFAIASRLSDKSIAGTIDKDDIASIVAWPEDELPILMAAADKVRRHFHSNTIDACSLMNIKAGNCSEDCSFCAQSSHHATGVSVSDLAKPVDVEKNFRTNTGHNLDFCVVSSGRGLDSNEIDSVIESVKKCGGPMHASLGIISGQDLKRLKDAGIVCYNHNLETGRSYFKNVVSTHTYEERVETIRTAKRIGMQACCGGIFGIGESWDDRLELLQTLKELDVDIVPINFFVPVPGTRAQPQHESPRGYLKLVSLFRLVLPKKIIKVCGGREVNLRALQSMIFYAGANGLISGGYLTTGGAGISADEQMMKDLGLKQQ